MSTLKIEPLMGGDKRILKGLRYLTKCVPHKVLFLTMNNYPALLGPSFFCRFHASDRRIPYGRLH